MSLTCITVPVITDSIVRQKLPQHVEQELHHYQLADDVFSDCHIKVDILVGLDQFWRLVRPGGKRLSESLVIMDTAFGSVISGSWSPLHDRETTVHTVTNHTLFTLTAATDV